MKKHTLSLIFFLTLVFSYGQQKTIKFNAFGIEEGLSQSHVTSIIQDHHGYIWIATQDGLNQFDGYQFNILKQNLKDTNSIPNNYIHCLVENEGLIWFGTNRGIGSFNTNTKKIARLNRGNYPKLRGYIFKSLGFDSYGRLWALSEKHGINIIDLESKQIEIISTINEHTDFSTLTVDEDFNIWVGTTSGKIYKSSETYKSFVEIKNENIELNGAVNSIVQSHSRLVYVCTETGVYVVENNQPIRPLGSFSELNYQNINSVYEENENRVWVGSKDFGLFLWSKEEGQEQLFQYKKNPYNKSSIVDNHVNYLYGDKSGCIWVGTEKGVAKFDVFKQGFTSVAVSNNPSEGLIDHTVWSFNEDSLHHIYIGTKKDLTEYNASKNKYIHYRRKDNKNHYLLSIYVENPARIWCGFDDGLFLLSKSDSKNYNFQRIKFVDEDELNQSRVYQIVRADDQTLWVGSRAGLTLINVNSFDYSFYGHSDDENSIGEGAVKVIYRDLSGKIWLVTSNQGLYNIIQKAEGDYYFKHYPIVGYNETNGHLTSILQTSKGSLWLGTYGEGLKRLDLATKETINYTEYDGLANNVIYGLLYDGQGEIWVSTNKGLSRFNMEKETFINYTTNDGLQSNEFNTNAYFKSTQNKFYFGGINGFTMFNPSEININPTQPNVIISDMIIHSKEKKSANKNTFISNITDSTAIKLPYYQNDISFEFFCDHFSNPEQNSFKYILEGYDENYIFLNNDNKVHYMNLASGKYTFKVYGKNPDGVWSVKPTKVTIVITPPFWLTWWFILLSIVFVALLIYYVYRKRIDRIRRQKIKLELEVVKRTRKISNQNKQIKEQNKQVELQKAKIEHQKELLQKEKVKVENILLNILPEGTASDLINKGKSKARYYRRVSVMFTDFVGFSKIAEGMKPQDLVAKLDEYFTKFDEIVGKYDLEKIKTIGDSYMCAGGVPIRNKSNAIEITLAALEIQDYMRVRELRAQTNGEDNWKIRIGRNSIFYLKIKYGF